MIYLLDSPKVMNHPWGMEAKLLLTCSSVYPICRFCSRGLFKITVCVTWGLSAVAAILGGVLHGNRSDRCPTAGAIHHLTSLGITAADAFSDENSPQVKTVEWMISLDPMKLSVTDDGFIQR